MAASTEEETFDYVVARPWDASKPWDTTKRVGGLCIYSYRAEVQNGTMRSAQGFLDYVRNGSPDHADEYAIYRVSFERLD